jgi:type IV pilus assembly protein PilQ
VVISTQEAKTKVVVADGETVVIGGLTRNENQESESGIPFLKDIPILGNLFKYSRKQVIKKDLVIFVTPRIIRNYTGNVQTSEPSVEKVGKAPEAKPVEAKPVEAKKAPAKKVNSKPVEEEYEEVAEEEVVEEVVEEDVVEAPAIEE